MSELKVNSIVDASGGSTAKVNGFTPTISNMSGRNRIINGEMRIDQRNAGASVSITGAPYTLDRWLVLNGTDGACTVQQDTVAPSGFVNSLKYTTTTADASLTGTQASNVQQFIEGLNVSDLGWGTAAAQSITISFWVRSSLTGTFGGALRNSNSSRAYPFTYAISSANTWEYKTVSIPGDTTGTWLTNNGTGINLIFSMGAGPDRSGTAGAWNSNNNTGTTGAVSVIGTLNATFYITGVQLEAGSVATPFERRPYGTELALCKRYFHKLANPMFRGVEASSSTAQRMGINFYPVMRATPTVTLDGILRYFNGSNTGTMTASNLNQVWATPSSFDFDSDRPFMAESAPGKTCVAYTATSGVVECHAVMSAEL